MPRPELRVARAPRGRRARAQGVLCAVRWLGAGTPDFAGTLGSKHALPRAESPASQPIYPQKQSSRKETTHTGLKAVRGSLPSHCPVPVTAPPYTEGLHSPPGALFSASKVCWRPRGHCLSLDCRFQLCIVGDDQGRVWERI